MSRDEYFILFIRQFDDKCDWLKRVCSTFITISCVNRDYSIHLLLPRLGKRDFRKYYISIDGGLTLTVAQLPKVKLFSFQQLLRRDSVFQHDPTVNIEKVGINSNP